MSAVVRRIRTVPSWQVTLGIALAALGFLIAAQLASEPPRVRYTTQERPPLVETVQTLQSQQDALKSQILDLRARIQALEQEGQGSQALVQQLNVELDQARIAAGLVALKGPGIVFQLEDSPRRVPTGGNPSDYVVSADDVRILVAQLWLSGAEAVAVNGERVIQSTAIIDIGGSILVNSAYLAAPYQVTAIGPKNIYSKLSASPEFVAFVRSRSETFGIKLSFAEPPSVDIPAFAGTINLRYARIGPGPSPSPSP
jgi:uncharacterized protein YlxW (UPF0749 family)